MIPVLRQIMTPSFEQMVRGLQQNIVQRNLISQKFHRLI